MTEGLQRSLFPERVSFVSRRRVTGATAKDVRFRRERITGAVLKRIRIKPGWIMAIVECDGRKRDETVRGCLVQVDAAELEPCPAPKPKARRRRRGARRKKGARRG